MVGNRNENVPGSQSRFRVIQYPADCLHAHPRTAVKRSLSCLRLASDRRSRGTRSRLPLVSRHRCALTRSARLSCERSQNVFENCGFLSMFFLLAESTAAHSALAFLASPVEEKFLVRPK